MTEEQKRQRQRTQAERYRKAHREEVNAKNRKYKRRHRAEVNAKELERYYANHEANLERMRAYRETHRDDLNSKKRVGYYDCNGNCRACKFKTCKCPENYKKLYRDSSEYREQFADVPEWEKGRKICKTTTSEPIMQKIRAE